MQNQSPKNSIETHDTDHTAHGRRARGSSSGWSRRLTLAASRLILAAWSLILAAWRPVLAASRLILAASRRLILAAWRPVLAAWRRPILAPWRRPILAAGAVVALGAVVGSGFAVQTAYAVQSDNIAATAALTEAGNPGLEQLDAHSGILGAQAVQQAEATLGGANNTITAAQGKTDATQLAADAAALDDYTFLAPQRIFELVDTTKAHTATVQAAVTAVDQARAAAAAAAAQAAAEQAAAQKAAAAQAAAAQAAAQKAAAPKAAAPRAAAGPSAPANPSGAQAIARDMAAQRGWGADQFGCLVSLWNKESGWRVSASNPSSGAYGIPQALPGSKMATAGADWQTNAATQISWGLSYIASAYGTPCAAWSHSQATNWY